MRRYDLSTCCRKVYTDFGFNEILVKLSTRPAKRVGSEEQWDKAEAALQSALNHKKLSWDLQPGEGAFYGPKNRVLAQGQYWSCVAMWHLATRFFHAGAVGCRICGRG